MPSDVIKLSPHVWVLTGRTNIGCIKHEGRAFVIDSGPDDASAAGILAFLKQAGLELDALIITHTNPDHIGGNSYLQHNTRCRFLGTLPESAVAYNSFMTPYTYWGAAPFPGIFSQVKPISLSRIEIIANQGLISDTGLRAVTLPGHYLDMIGIHTPDDIFFLADALLPPETMNKYKFVFTMDVQAFINTMDMLEHYAATWFVPSHVPPTKDIGPLLAANRAALRRLSEAVFAACSDYVTREEIVLRLADNWQLKMDPLHFLQNVMTVAAHLSWLANRDLVRPVMDARGLMWKRA